MSHCDDCFKGVKHDGAPEGKWLKIGDVDAYVSTPTCDYEKDKVIIFLTDIVGPQFINNRLLSDAFARNGFKVIIPDLFNGDPVSEDVLSGKLTWNREQWVEKHSPDKARPIVDKVLAALKEQNITTIGATGYCYGARLAFDLAFDDLVHVVVVSHPSQLAIPGDLEKYAQTVKAPLLINSCPVDSAFPPAAQAKADEIFGGEKFSPGYMRTYWEGCQHGFAVRGDLNDPKAKAGLEGAFRASANWFIKYL